MSSRRTTVAGAGRTSVANLPDIPVDAVLIDALSPGTVYIGTDIGVFVLGADGSWTPLTQGMPNVVVLGLSQNPDTGLLVAATHGRSTFALVQGGPALTAPLLDSVVNLASFAPGPVAPGMAASLFGSNLASATVLPHISFSSAPLSGRNHRNRQWCSSAALFSFPGPGELPGALWDYGTDG